MLCISEATGTLVVEPCLSNLSDTVLFGWELRYARTRWGACQKVHCIIKKNSLLQF
ncbi:MAG: hypothetical protein ACXADA_14425 [Candidatus Hodarchaeales archaeon]